MPKLKIQASPDGLRKVRERHRVGQPTTSLLLDPKSHMLYRICRRCYGSISSDIRFRGLFHAAEDRPVISTRLPLRRSCWPRKIRIEVLLIELTYRICDCAFIWSFQSLRSLVVAVISISASAFLDVSSVSAAMSPEFVVLAPAAVAAATDAGAVGVGAAAANGRADKKGQRFAFSTLKTNWSLN